MGDEHTKSFRFQPIRGYRVFEDVVDQLTYAIRSGVYKPGDRLPTLDELALEMQTSRPSISEAVGVLASAGVVETKRGPNGGTIVKSSAVPSSVLGLSRSSRQPSLQDLLEARRPIDLALAQLAGQRATDENFIAIERTVEMLEPARGHPSAWVQANDLFHYEVARAARSSALAIYSHQIMEELAILLDSFDERFVDYEHTIWVHTETLAALRSRDPVKIGEIMDDHIHELEVTTARVVAAKRSGRRANEHGVSARTQRRMNERLPRDDAPRT